MDALALALAHIRHPRVSKVANPGIEVPGQYGMALKCCRHQALCQCLKTHLSRPATLLSSNAGVGWNVAEAYSSGLLAKGEANMCDIRVTYVTYVKGYGVNLK